MVNENALIYSKNKICLVTNVQNSAQDLRTRN